MKTRHPREQLATYGPPLLLVLVALSQIYMAWLGDATPSKGGGFGLFSTVDKLENRRVMVWLRKEGRNNVFVSKAFISSHARSLRWVRAVPSRSRMAALAVEVAKFSGRTDLEAVRVEVVKMAFDGASRRLSRKVVGTYLLELDGGTSAQAR